MDEIAALLEFGREMFAAFQEYFSALDELVKMGNTRMAAASSHRYQAAYRALFGIAGRYFNRDAEGNKLAGKKGR